jgi:hypothetical protein
MAPGFSGEPYGSAGKHRPVDWLPEKIMRNYLLKGFSFPTFKRLTGILTGRTREIPNGSGKLSSLQAIPPTLLLVRHFLLACIKLYGEMNEGGRRGSSLPPGPAFIYLFSFN